MALQLSNYNYNFLYKNIELITLVNSGNIFHNQFQFTIRVYKFLLI